MNKLLLLLSVTTILLNIPIMTYSQSNETIEASNQEQTSEEYAFLEKDLTPEIAEKIKRLQFMETFALPLTIIITVAVISLTVFFVKKRKNKTTT